MTLKGWLWEYRRQASLLLAAGHPHAKSYPLGFLVDEANLVARRQKAIQASEATLIKTAISAVLDSKAAKQFAKIVKDLTEEG